MNNQTNQTVKSSNKETSMNTSNTYMYKAPESIADYSAKRLIDHIKAEVEANAKQGANNVGVTYAVRWAITKAISKRMFKVLGVAHFMLARAVRNRSHKGVSEAMQLYRSIGIKMQTAYDGYSEHANLMNAFLADIESKMPDYDRFGNKREAFSEIEFHPFMRRIVNDGIEHIDESCSHIPEMDDSYTEEERELYQAFADEQRLIAEMSQSHLKHHQSNVTQAINGRQTVISESITMDAWIDDLSDRSKSEIYMDAKMGGWAMLYQLALKASNNQVVKGLIEDTPLANVDWSTAKAGKALSLAVKCKSRIVSNIQFINSMTERREHLINQRLKLEHESNGTISESSLPVSGAQHDEQVSQIDDYIGQAEREIEQLRPIAKDLYYAAQRFGTAEDPMPDFRTGFGTDPSGYDLGDAVVVKIEVEVPRKGRTLKKPIWLVYGFGGINKMVEIAAKCRKARWDMTQREQFVTLDKLSAIATDNAPVSQDEINELIDGLL